MRYDPSFHINSVTNMHCDCCGKEIHIHSLIAICPMCDAVFCESCIQNSCLENHQCEPASPAEQTYVDGSFVLTTTDPEELMAYQKKLQ